MVSGTRRPWREGTVLIREATLEDAGAIAAKMATADVAELYALSGLEPREGMMKSHAISDESWALESDTLGILSMWGVVKDDEGPAANIWLICSPEVKAAPISFSKIVKEQVLSMADRFGILYCYADGRNTDHHRWLKRIGFHETRVLLAFGFEKRTFHEFIGGSS